MSSLRSVCLPRMLSAALLAVTAAVGGSAIGQPAIACAAPNSAGWDDDKYTSCIVARIQRWDHCCGNAGGTAKRGADGVMRCYKPGGAGPVPPSGAGPAGALPAPPPPIEVVPRPTVIPPRDAAAPAPPPPPFVTVTPAPANPG